MSRTFCIGFNVVFSLFAGNMYKRRPWENCDENDRSDDLRIHRRSIGGYRHTKKKVTKGSWRILKKFGATEALHGLS